MVIREIVEQHAEEAAFLWTQRDQAVVAPHYTAKRLAALDERVEAHLDGLRIAGDVGWEICEAALGQGKEGEIFAAAELAFESGDPEKIKKILTVGCAKPQFERALISALGWIPFEQAKPCLDALIKDPNPKVRRVGIAGFAVHSQDPGPALLAAVIDKDHRLRARAIEAVAELGRRDLAGYIRSPNTYEDEYSRFAAAWALGRFGWPNEALKSIVDEAGPYAERALHMAILMMEPPAARAWCQSLMARPETIRLGIRGLGIVGIPECIDDLLPLMRDKQFARLAGHSFSMITGADLSSEPLEGKRPDDLEEKPSEDSESEDVAPDPDNDLPWPAADAVEEWWAGPQEKFLFGKRYMLGREITIASLKEFIKTSRPVFRGLGAVQLAALEPDPIAEVRRRHGTGQE